MQENGDNFKSSKKIVTKTVGRRDTRIPSNFRKERTYVHLCWIYMWCGTFKQQERKEKFFRLNQLIQVIAKLKAKCMPQIDTELFALIIDTCYKDGEFKMTKKVYETMRRYETPPNNGILLRYFNQQQ